MSVCLSVGSHICQKPHVEIFCTCSLLPWLGPSLATMQYDTYLWMTLFSHNGANGPESKIMLCFVEFARWRHQGRSCCLRLRACRSCSRMSAMYLILVLTIDRVQTGHPDGKRWLHQCLWLAFIFVELSGNRQRHLVIAEV